jgi:hypothetical protein
MSIGNCDCCDRTNVPGSVVNVPGEPFACFICQADPWESNPDPDPYGEMEIDCADCDGAGCDLCAGFGKFYVETTPVTLQDLEEMGRA